MSGPTSATRAIRRLRDAALERFGTVHVLCNNAMVGGGGPFCEPIDFGRLVVRAIRADALYVNSHRETLAWLQGRINRMIGDADRIGTLR